MEGSLETQGRLTTQTLEQELEAPTAGEIAISVRNAGKKYMLYDRPQDRLKQSLFWRWGRSYGREFWALRDVSFEVRRGESVGIIGRNGSGKSTLLQIIAGTLQPTTGTVEVKGRVAALLELGSGFNPEYTGRENVLMNGAILGLSRREMEERYEDIAAFADIGEFIDQPVKVYSSGMAMRLAFAVQLVVPKEILIVDEALAVGDEAFARKCLRAMEEFQDSGGTILLVSHDTQTINRRCQEAILLVRGRMLIKDRSKLVTDVYQRILYGSERQRQFLVESLLQKTFDADASDQALPLDEKAVAKLIARPELAAVEAHYDPALPMPPEHSYGNGKARIVDPAMLDESGNRVNVLVSGWRYHWRYRAHFENDVQYVHFGMMLKTIDGVTVCATSTRHECEIIPLVRRGEVIEVDFALDMNLAPGTYFLNAGVSAIEHDSFVYLHRRVDVGIVRVIPCDTREVDGFTFMNHQIRYWSVVTAL